MKRSTKRPRTDRGCDADGRSEWASCREKVLEFERTTDRYVIETRRPLDQRRIDRAPPVNPGGDRNERFRDAFDNHRTLPRATLDNRNDRVRDAVPADQRKFPH